MLATISDNERIHKSRTGKSTEFRGRPVPSTPDITTQQQEKVPPMFKKTLISLAVASSLGLTGCFDSAGDGGNANPDYKISQDKNRADFLAQFEGKTWPVFDPFPAVSDLPIPNDLIYSNAGDGSFAVADTQPPVTTALNQLSGASTIAPIDIKFSGEINNVRGPRPLSDPEAILQNVFLIELDYASGDPLRGLRAGEVPSGAPFNNFITEVRELSGDTYLRILPVSPLDPYKRYVVVLTNEITDGADQQIVSSPAYTELKDESQVLGPSVDRVRTLINSFWEKTALQAFNTAALPVGPGGALVSLNDVRQANDFPALEKGSIALSYSFTTSNDKQVLNYIANPANWIRDQVRLAVTSAAVENVTDAFDDLEADPTNADFQSAVQSALDGFAPSERFSATPFASILEESCDPLPAELKFQCVGDVFYGGLTSVAGIKFPAPSAQAFDIKSTTDAAQLSAVLSTVLANPEDPAEPITGKVDVHQGYIDLPYFLNTPLPQSNGSEIQARGWKADTQLAAALAQATGFAIPQADASKSTVLNSVFPFPEQSDVLRSPLLVLTPSGVTLEELQNEANSYNAVIFQHGITTDRSAALAFGSALIDNDPTGNTIVFAIDQPLHGVSPSSTKERSDLAETLLSGASIIDEDTSEQEAAVLISQVVSGTFVSETALPPILISCEAAQTAENPVAFILAGNCGLEAAQQLGQALVLQQTVANSGSTIPGLSPADGDVKERHFNFGTNTDNQIVSMNFDPDNAVGKSGDLFINLLNFTNSRDNLRQGAVDLMNVRATIETLEGVGNVYLVGHSLGTVNGAAFVASANSSGRPELAIQGAHLMTPASGIVRMLENSPSFAPRILGGLAQATSGTVVQGTSGLETFLNVFQIAIDSVDPINFTPELAQKGLLVSEISGDRTTVNAAFEAFGTPPLSLDLSVIGIPLNIKSSQAPLAGSTPFINGLVDTESELFMFERYEEGVHGTPVLPTEELAELPRVDEETGEPVYTVLKDRTLYLTENEETEVIVSAENASIVFSGLIGDTLGMILSDGYTTMP
ncbi:hypothetical protein ABIE59_000517 [Marinobacter sp. MBR-99]|uniref:hypothetical protein n=1 Tax=Marinobacter sp. MBR-99 TaxID=3156461 RepID=UPI003397BE11